MKFAAVTTGALGGWLFSSVGEYLSFAQARDDASSVSSFFSQPRVFALTEGSEANITKSSATDADGSSPASEQQQEPTSTPIAEKTSATSSLPEFVSTDNAVIVADDAAWENSLCYEKTWGIHWVPDWDNPQERGAKPAANKSSSRAFRQILMIRHGQYRNESADDDSIRTLTELGEQQAKLTGEYLERALKGSKLFVNDKVWGLYCSDLTRARQTAQFMFPGKTAVEDPLLRERFPCVPQPNTTSKKNAKSCDMIDAEECFSKYIHRPLLGDNGMKTVDVLVGHGNTIRYMLCRSLQIPPEAWLRFSLPHCSLTSIKVSSSGRVSVNMVGGAGHLPVEMQTVSNIA